MPYFRYCHFRWLFCLLALVLTSVSFSVMREDDPPADAGDPEYRAGVAAWEREDWPAVIEHMNKAIERRPEHDDAHNLLGFAYRKQGDYERSLQHYHKALELNPQHRGALEYLGETYLALDRLDQANATLDRLAAACGRRRTPAAAEQAEPDCEEWRELKTAIDAYRQGKPASGSKSW